jgi:hypothetical protein
LQQYLTPYVVGLDNNVYLGKVDWNIGPNDRLSVRYNASRYNGVNQESPGSTSALQHTGNNQVNTDNLSASYTKVIGRAIGVGRAFQLGAGQRTGSCQHQRA